MRLRPKLSWGLCQLVSDRGMRLRDCGRYATVTRSHGLANLSNVVRECVVFPHDMLPHTPHVEALAVLERAR